MAKKKTHNRTSQSVESLATKNPARFIAPVAIVMMLGAAAAIFFQFGPGRDWFGKAKTKQTTNLSNAEAGTNTQEMGLDEPIRMNVAQAVMVTQEFDFGGNHPTIAQAVSQIERSYKPDDGVGRTFAILDAYGDATPDGKLRISMHVSSEKPGLAELKFKGKPIWRARIGNPGDPPAGQKNLMIYVADGKGGNHVLDGGRGGSNALDVFLQNSQQKLRDVWPNGAEREVTFVYSACGCPVKTMVRRTGERTQRVKDTPVLFPDDPAAVTMIANLMKW